MQIFSLIGAMIIAWCGIEGARRLNHQVQSDINIIDAYVVLLRYVRAQIDCYALPISDIFHRCDRELLFLCGWSMEEGPKNFKELFLCSYIRDKMARSIISEFCADFGQNYRDEQLKRCDVCISSLEVCRERMASEVWNRKKLNLTLCLSGSFALIILLV